METSELVSRELRLMKTSLDYIRRKDKVGWCAAKSDAHMHIQSHWMWLFHLQYTCLRDALNGSGVEFPPTIGLDGIVDKFDSYVSLDDFLIDIDDLQRSYSAHYGSEWRFISPFDISFEKGVCVNRKKKYHILMMFSFVLLSETRHIVKAADSLSMECHSDAKSIRNCVECFQFWVNDRFCSFTKVCSTPHMPVYAKVGTFPFWPAKVILLFYSFGISVMNVWVHLRVKKSIFSSVCLPHE